MPRKHQKAPGSRPYANWSEENMHNALAEIRTGSLSYREAQDKYNIPKSTLERKYNNKNMKKIGRPTELDVEEETKLVDGLIVLADWGYPVSHLELRLLVKSYLDSIGAVNSRFHENMPGEEWCVSFLERHKNRLSTRLCSNIKRARSEVSREQLTEYFTNLQESLIGVSPENIINYDETNMSDDPGKKKVLIKRGSKRADRIIDSSKSSTSVMFAATATGVLLPLYVVYKAEHMHSTWTQGGRLGTRYNRSRSGWFDSVLFEDFFDEVIITYFNDLEREKGEKCLKLIIGDNLSSHVSLSVIKKCEEHGIKFVFMPPNATHLCQPLDVAFFRGLKQSWRNKLTEWKLRNRGVVPKDTFPRLLKNTLISMGDNIKTNLISGFKAAGIHPCDPNAVLKRLPEEPRQSASSDTQWSEVFTDYLKKGREKPATQKQKRKRINVAPGKSVTEIDFNMPSTSNQVPSPSNEIELVCYRSTSDHESDSPENGIIGEDPLTMEIETDDYFDTEDMILQSYHNRNVQFVNSKSKEDDSTPSDHDENNQIEIDKSKEDTMSSNQLKDSQNMNASSVECREEDDSTPSYHDDNNQIEIDKSKEDSMPSNQLKDSQIMNTSSGECIEEDDCTPSDHNENNQIEIDKSKEDSMPSNPLKDSQIMNTSSVECIEENEKEANYIQHHRKTLRKLKKQNNEKDEENTTKLGPKRKIVLKVNDFVLVNLIYNENTKRPVRKYFVAKIISLQPDGILCKFLRKSQKTENTFIYPPIDDEILIQSKDINRILMQPTINRGRHIFKDLKNIKF